MTYFYMVENIYISFFTIFFLCTVLYLSYNASYGAKASLNYFYYKLPNWSRYSCFTLSWFAPLDLSFLKQLTLFIPETYLLFVAMLQLLFLNHLRKYYEKKEIFVCGFVMTVISLFVTMLFLIITFSHVLTAHAVIFNGALCIDVYSLLVKLLIIILTITFLLGSFNKFLQSDFDMIEYPTLIIFSTLFLLTLLSSHNLITLYLSIEGLSITLYMLTVFNHHTTSIEAGVKYFVTGAVSSGFLVFGMLGIYGKTGSFDLLYLSHTFAHWSIIGLNQSNIFLSLALLSFVLGFIIKLGAFPCHMWAIDVYEGTWLPTTFYFMVVAKTGMFFTFLKIFIVILQSAPSLELYPFIFCSLVGSIFVGSIGALTQKRLKRVLAYSSLSQIGFCLLGFASGNLDALSNTVFFFVVYILTSCSMFLIVLNTESFIEGKELVYITDLNNLKKNNPILAIVLSIFLLSLAGIPPLLGFYTKAFLFSALLSAKLYTLCIIAILGSIINAFVYIRLIKCLFFDENSVGAVGDDYQTLYWLPLSETPSILDKYFKYYKTLFTCKLLIMTLFLTIGPMFIISPSLNFISNLLISLY